MKLNKCSVIIFAIIGFQFIMAACFYSRLPDRMAIHWSSSGADGYMAKRFAAFCLPAICLVTLLPFAVISMFRSTVNEIAIKFWMLKHSWIKIGFSVEDPEAVERILRKKGC